MAFAMNQRERSSAYTARRSHGVCRYGRCWVPIRPTATRSQAALILRSTTSFEMSWLFDEGRRRPRQGTRRKIVVVLVHTLAQSSSVVRCEHGRRSPSARRGSKRLAMFFDRGRTNVPADRLHNRTMSIAVRTRLPSSLRLRLQIYHMPPRRVYFCLLLKR